MSLLMLRSTVSAGGGGGGSMPAWMSAMTDKTWSSTVVGNTVNDLDPGVTNFAHVVAGGYGGGTACSHRSSLIIQGGGHAATYFNGTPEVRFDTDTPVWALSTTFTPGTERDQETYTDGSPHSTHLQDFMIDRTGSDSTYMLTVSQAHFDNGGSWPGIWEFNHATGVRTKRADFTGVIGNFANSAGGSSWYDPENDLMYLVTQYGDILEYNPTTHVDTLRYDAFNLGGPEVGYQVGGHVWPTGRCGIIYSSQTNQLWIADLDNITAGLTGPITPTGAPTFATGAGSSWHEASGGFIVWGHSTSRENLYKLSPPTLTPSTFADLSSGTWAFSTVTPDASNSVTPTAPVNEGTFRRGTVINNINGSGRDIFAVVNSATGSTYVYKLPAAGV